MINTVSVGIDLAREIYERLISKECSKTKKIWTQKESSIIAAELTDENNWKSNYQLFTKLTADLKYEEIS